MWTPTQNDCEPFTFGSFGLTQRSAACDPLVAAWSQYDNEYDEALATLLDDPFAEQTVNALLDEWTAQVEDAMTDAANTHGDAPSISQWESAVDSFLEDLETTRNDAAAELAS